ncbi:MAG: hypothetical protein J6W48_03450 [Lachnospiraceae bacterium]|nr:hypothetical protein [Lachnospiraceae bacterium]
MECIKVGKEERYIKDFLDLAKKLYTKQDNMESPDTIRKFLTGEHPMSKYFTLDAYLIYDGDRAVGRFALTIYPDDTVCYLGFFECIDDKDTATFLFSSAETIAKEMKCSTIEGPVDASFWNKYRLKINNFDRPPYTGEPYNKEYYYNLFLANGYTVKEHYTSNAYRAVDDSYVNEKFEGRYNAFLEQGYRIESPRTEDYEKILDEVYRMITELYSDFPIYKHVSKEDFKEMFMSYKSIMNMSMTKIAYYKDKTVGFYISLPDYGNKVYHLNLPNLLSILKTKKHPKQYVMLYMGVDAEHRGLGKAIVYSIIKELEANRLPSIGALARDGKVTQTYVIEEATSIYEYVLLEHTLE